MFRINGRIGFVLFLGILAQNISLTQGINDEKTSLTNYLKRMYNNSPFTGVKVVEDYENKYLISVVSLDSEKYKNASTMNRVAQVKAQSQASIFLNGTVTSTDLIINTIEKKTKDSTSTIIETIEQIKENGVGFVKGMELLTKFSSEDGKIIIFIFAREIK